MSSLAFWDVLRVPGLGLLGLTLGLALGCAPPLDPALVGAACRNSGDCVERCVDGGDFPDGMCTVDCNHDGHCPDDSICMDKKGGICMVPCGNSGDCWPGYACKDVKNEDGGGKRRVCIGD